MWLYPCKQTFTGRTMTSAKRQKPMVGAPIAPGAHHAWRITTLPA
jgi:hypothetical protein